LLEIGIWSHVKGKIYITRAGQSWSYVMHINAGNLHKIMLKENVYHCD